MTDLRENTYLSEKHCINDFREEYKKGCSLKRKALKHWIHRKDYVLADIAKLFGISTKTFRRRLYYKKRFSMKQIERLVYLMGAKAAFRMIYFPTYKEKQRVYKEAFEEKGMIKDKEHKKEEYIPHTLRAEKIRTNVAYQRAEYGEDFEQSEQLEDMMLYSDELPSRKWYRSR